MSLVIRLLSPPLLCPSAPLLPCEFLPRLNRQRQRPPAEGQGDLHQRWVVGQHGAHLGRGAIGRELTRPNVEQAVGVAQNPLEAMFGQNNGQSQIFVEPHEGLQNFLGRLRVELAGGFIQNQDLRPQGERTGDGHPLPFATREGDERPLAQVG